MIDEDGGGKVDAEVIARYELPDFTKCSLAVVGGRRRRPAMASARRRVRHGGRQVPADVDTADERAGRVALDVDRAAPRIAFSGRYARRRAWLLIRMGEADAARAMVQSVDVENYTPKLFQVGMQAMLAAGDPGGMCVLVTPALRDAPDRNWRLAEAMCAGLEGDPRPRPGR